MEEFRQMFEDVHFHSSIKCTVYNSSIKVGPIKNIKLLRYKDSNDRFGFVEFYLLDVCRRAFRKFNKRSTLRGKEFRLEFSNRSQPFLEEEDRKVYFKLIRLDSNDRSLKSKI